MLGREKREAFTEWMETAIKVEFELASVNLLFMRMIFVAACGGLVDSQSKRAFGGVSAPGGAFTRSKRSL